MGRHESARDEDELGKYSTLPAAAAAAAAGPLFTKMSAAYAFFSAAVGLRFSVHAALLSALAWIFFSRSSFCLTQQTATSWPSFLQ